MATQRPSENLGREQEKDRKGSPPDPVGSWACIHGRCPASQPQVTCTHSSSLFLGLCRCDFMPSSWAGPRRLSVSL